MRSLASVLALCRRRSVLLREEYDAVTHDGVETPVKRHGTQQKRRLLGGGGVMQFCAADAVRVPRHRQETAAALVVGDGRSMIGSDVVVEMVGRTGSAVGGVGVCKVGLSRGRDDD